MWLDVRIQTAALCVATEEASFATHALDAGALVLFQGRARELDGPIAMDSLWVEAYPGVTENEICRIAKTAALRWPLLACQVRHRVGHLLPHEIIVLVLTAAKHRAAAFAAADFLMDFLKQEAPLWKREQFIDGSTRWVEPHAGDRSAIQRWQGE